VAEAGGHSRMVYVKVTGIVYLTNGNIIGFVREDVFYSFPHLP
jgi:hypothetical protein